jgi:hypothetical protein
MLEGIREQLLCAMGKGEEIPKAALLLKLGARSEIVFGFMTNPPTATIRPLASK